ncbi:MAG TPA: T9SS type A sorting domain-containing protein [Chitinivibrionales bacterium]|nr:T9SS type A sorting domain-containing protein [Chitinivibrionales bacterium]
MPFPGVYLADQAFGLFELGIATLREPLLSSAVIRGWKDKGAAVRRDTLDTCVVSYATTADSSWAYTIDKNRWVITALLVHQSSPDSNVFNGIFLYGDSGGVPLLEKIALMRDTSMNHGGYVFSNIKINEPLPDSMFNSAVIHARRPVEAGRIGISVNPSSVMFEFPKEAGIASAAVYNAAGRKIKSLDVDRNSSNYVWRYGNSLQTGFYFVHARGEKREYCERFLITR